MRVPEPHDWLQSPQLPQSATSQLTGGSVGAGVGLGVGTEMQLDCPVDAFVYVLVAHGAHDVASSSAA
jgi:transketolase N-terminal domain/subunit